MAYGRGHVKTTPKVTRKATQWYDAIAEEHIKRIEAELAAKTQQQGK